MLIFSKRTLRGTLALLALVAALVLGIWLGGHPSTLPSFARSAFEANHATEVVDEAIAKIAQTYYRPLNQEQLVSASIEGLTASLHDPYTEYLNPKNLKGFEEPASFSGVGVEVNQAADGLEVERVFNGSPAQRSGLREGEVITAVNGRSLHGVPPATAQKLITGEPGTTVALTLARGHSSRVVTITRAIVSEPVVASRTYEEHGVKLGWIYLAQFSEGCQAQVRGAVRELLAKHVQGLVLDLRADGGGLVSEAIAVASAFIPSGTIVTTKGREQPTDTMSALGNAIAPTIPMVVLVDHGTASASEIVTAALQDHHRATVVGTHTYGKGVYQELEQLSNGAAIKVTVGQYFTPDGRNLGGKDVSRGAGITPEVFVSEGIDSPHGLKVALETLAEKVR